MPAVDIDDDRLLPRLQHERFASLGTVRECQVLMVEVDPELCGSFVELVEEGVNGFGMDPFDEDSIVEALRKMEALGDEDRACFSRRSVNRIAEHGLEPWARRVAEFLTRLASRPAT